MPDKTTSEVSAASFRPIHYLGNKSRLLEAIEVVIDEVTAPGAGVCDLFAGSGVVSRHLSMKRPVFASDIQEYSRVLTSALTKPGHFDLEVSRRLISEATSNLEERLQAIEPLVDFEDKALRVSVSSPGQLADIIEHEPMALASLAINDDLTRLMLKADHNLGAHARHTMLRNYGGVYFSFLQAASLDAISDSIISLNESQRDTAKAALLGVASEIASTVGNHFAQPIRPRDGLGKLKTGWASTLQKRRTINVFDSFANLTEKYSELSPTPCPCETATKDFREALDQLDSSTGVIYADPPYTRDHYSRFYHVLETIALGDEPGISTSTIAGRQSASRGLYRKERHQSPFSIKSEVTSAFEYLFKAARRRSIPVVLSYSPSTSGTISRPQSRLITIPELADLARPYFREVRVESAGTISHSKFNSQHLNSEIDPFAEVFIIGTY